MGIILLVILAWPAYTIISWGWSLLMNYRAAKKSGLPILISPFSPDLVSPMHSFLFYYFTFYSPCTNSTLTPISLGT